MDRRTLLLCLLCFSVAAQPGRVSREGELLVATSTIPDPRFAQTVILIIEDGEQGTVGLVVNRPAGRMAERDVFSQLGIESPGGPGSTTVYEGGPVFPDQLFALHTADVLLPESKTVAEGVALTEATKILARVGEGKGPAKVKLILGYAGWARGQLDFEMTTGSWLLVPCRPSLVFSDEPEQVWRKIMDEFTMRM